MTAVFYSEDARRLHIKQPRYEQGWCGAELQGPPIEYRRDFRTPICASCLDILDAKRAALRAQLDAAQQWRPVTEQPAADQPAEIVIRATYSPYGRLADSHWQWYDDDGDYIQVEVLRWRPLPAAPGDGGKGHNNTAAPDAGGGEG